MRKLALLSMFWPAVLFGAQTNDMATHGIVVIIRAGQATNEAVNLGQIIGLSNTLAGSISGASQTTFATNSVTATNAINAATATQALFSVTGNFATGSVYATSSGYATNSGSTTFSHTGLFATGATYSASSGFSTNAGSATFSASSLFATGSTYAASSGFATNAGSSTFSVSSLYATNSGTATFAANAGSLNSIPGTSYTTNKNIYGNEFQDTNIIDTTSSTGLIRFYSVLSNNLAGALITPVQYSATVTLIVNAVGPAVSNSVLVQFRYMDSGFPAALPSQLLTNWVHFYKTNAVPFYRQ